MVKMEYLFTIRFARKAVLEYRTAQEVASRFSRFYPVKEGEIFNNIETSNVEVTNKFEHFVKLMDLIKDWDNTRFLHNGMELTINDFKWPEKREIANCHMKYMDATDKDNYCDDKSSDCWGCRLLRGIILHHTRASYDKNARYWYQYGSYMDKNTWRVSRELLTEALEVIVKDMGLEFCPVFESQFYRKYVAALPRLIHMEDSNSWACVFKDYLSGSSKHWEPVNVRHRTPNDPDFEDDAQEGLFTNSTKPGMHLKDETATDAGYLRFVPATSFADIGGVDDIIQNIRIMIELPLLKPKLFEQLGVKPYRGILLWGDPGNGKTLIAKAIAHEVKAHFIPVAGPDILNKNFGQSEQNLHDIFDEARKFQPSIIFIDEIDSIAQTRLSGESAKWYATVVNQLLALMDGITDYGNITVLASTNRPDLLDAALLRPGRFDYKLEIRKPTLPGCKRVLEIATRDMPLADDVDLFSFSESVVGYSAAEIVFLAKEAAMVALRKAVENKQVTLDHGDDTDYSFIKITMADFTHALHLLKWQRRYVNITYSLKDKKLT